MLVATKLSLITLVWVQQATKTVIIHHQTGAKHNQKTLVPYISVQWTTKIALVTIISM